MAVFSSAAVFGSYIAGRLSDTYGRKPLIVSSIAGTCIGFVLQAGCWNLTTLYIARIWGGLFANSLPIAQACVADVMPQKERPKYLGLIGATIGIGFTIGPGLGAFVFYLFTLGLDETASQRGVLLVCACVSMTSCLSAATRMLETKKTAQGTRKDAAASSTEEDINATGKDNEGEEKAGGPEEAGKELDGKEKEEPLSPHSTANASLIASLGNSAAVVLLLANFTVYTLTTAWP